MSSTSLYILSFEKWVYTSSSTAAAHTYLSVLTYLSQVHSYGRLALSSEDKKLIESESALLARYVYTYKGFDSGFSLLSMYMYTEIDTYS